LSIFSQPNDVQPRDVPDDGDITSESQEFTMFIGLRDLWYAKGRFVLMTTVVALVAFLIVMLSGLTAGLAAENTSAVASLPATHIVFGDTPDGASFTQSRLDVSAVDDWGAASGVIQAAPLGITRSAINSGESVIPIVVFGTESGAFIAPDSLSDQSTAVVSAELADMYGITPGDAIMIGETTFTAMIVADDSSFAHSPVVWVSLSDWQAIAGAGDTTSVIVLDTEYGFDGTADDGAIVSSVGDSFAAIGSFTEENSSLQMIRGFLLVISALVVGAFFTVWTIQRRHDVAVLKAMGASTKYLLVDALSQATIVLVTAAVVGGTTAFFFGRLLIGFVPFDASVGTTVLPLTALVAMGLAGAALAIRSITKVDPLSALGGN
jgi:putative ABC transport system permease protein